MAPNILSSPRGDHKTMQALSAQHIPHCTAYVSIPDSGRIDVGGSFRCTSSVRCPCPRGIFGERRLARLRRTCGKGVGIAHTRSLPQSLLHLEPIRADAIFRWHTSSHSIVDMSDDCYHLLWYPDASDYLPQKGAVDNNEVRLLEIN